MQDIADRRPAAMEGAVTVRDLMYALFRGTIVWGLWLDWERRQRRRKRA